uniref:Uncharacterized protein n=1 Tax=Arundo donax TaxID=35708 RepID=A0A0A9D2V5_ARUDO
MLILVLPAASTTGCAASASSTQVFYRCIAYICNMR